MGRGKREERRRSREEGRGGVRKGGRAKTKERGGTFRVLPIRN